MKAIRRLILTIAEIIALYFLIGLATTLWVIGLFLLYFGIARVFAKYIRRALAIGLFVFIFLRFGWVAALGFFFLNIGVPLPRVRQSDKHIEELTKLDAPIAANPQPVQATPHKQLDQPALPNNLGGGLNKRYEKSDTQVDERDRFDAFTEQARKVLSLAQEEAQGFQHNYIGTEHLLLGLIGVGEGVAAKVLSELGVKLDKIRSAVEFIIGRGDRIVPGAIGLTPRAKRVIELAVDEARHLNHTYIGTEHLLLGLAREGEGIAAGVLESLGVNLEDAREQTMKVLGPGQEPSSQSEQQESKEKQEKDLSHTARKRESSRLEVSPLIRLFISSTFSDFVFERDVLQRAVFPRLRALCAAQGCRFQPIDLRWGVSQEAGNEKRTLAICLKEVARCQRLSPDLNFLILLGDRYGSCFLPERIPSDQVERLLLHLASADRARFIQIDTEDQNILLPAYAEDHNALPPEYVLLPGARTEGVRQEENRLRMALAQAAERAGFSEQERLPFVASATHLEIQRGLLDAGCDPAATVCAFRTTSGIASGRSQTSLEVESPEQRARLEALKMAVERRLDGHVLYLPPNEIAGSSTDQTIEMREDDLAKRFLALLEPRVRDALAHRHVAAQMRDPAAEANQQFATARTSVVIGRDYARARVAGYLAGQTPRPLVVAGESGVGKSTLLAQAVQDATQAHPQAVVVTRYVGVTPGTSSLADLLMGLRRELAEQYGETPPESLGDLSQLVAAVATHLRTQAAPAERPLILVVDALDQFGDKRQRVDWLPPTLASNVRIVVSLRSDREELTTLRTWLPAEQILQLNPLPRMRGEEVLRQWLATEGRRLTPTQESAVLDGFAPLPEGMAGTGTPLYLRLAFEQARTWRSFEAVDPLPPTVPALLQTYFERLEQLRQHGRELVTYTLGYVAAAKHGLAEDELLDLLSRSAIVREALRRLSPGSPPIEAQRPLPVALWVRLAADLERSLTEREADGAKLVTFYHQQVRAEAERRYLDGAERTARHAELAAYFGEQLYQQGQGGIGVWNRRKLAELAYQEAESGVAGRPALATTLTDGRFLEGKLAVEGVAATLDDLKFVSDDEDIVKITVAIRAGAITLANDPSELPNQITGRVGQVVGLHDLPERAVPWLRLRTQSLGADPALLRILQGHTDDVTHCALSADGKLALSSSRDKTLRLWDTTNGEMLRILQGHEAGVTGCALSADGTRALSISGRELRLWDIASGGTIHILRGHTGDVTACALSTDGKLARSASKDRTLRLWNTVNDEIVCFSAGHTSIVTACALSADGKLALSASADGKMRLWDTNSGQRIRIWKFSSLTDVAGCTLSADGRRVLVVSNLLWGVLGRAKLQVWDSANGRRVRILKGFKGVVTSCALSANGRLALSGAESPTLNMVLSWRIRTRSLTALPAFVGLFRFLDDFESSTLRVWDTERGSTVRILEGHYEQVASCALSADGRLALSLAADGFIYLWDTPSGGRRLIGQSSSVPYSSSQVEMISLTSALSADGKLALSLRRGKGLCLWETISGKILHTLEGQGDNQDERTLSADGRRALTVSQDGDLRLWDTDSRRAQPILECHTGPVGDCALSADGHLALFAFQDRTLRLWDTVSGQEIAQWTYDIPLLRCALSADGRIAVAGDNEGGVHFLEVVCAAKAEDVSANPYAQLSEYTSPDSNAQRAPDPYPPQSAPVRVNKPGSGCGALAGLILGICIMIWLLPLPGYLVAIVGIILGIVLSALEKRSVSRKGMALASLVLSIIVLVLTLCNSALGVYLGVK